MAVSDIDKPSSNDVKCDHSEQSCPDGNTCCKLESGDYGCCPYDKVLITSHKPAHFSCFSNLYETLQQSTHELLGPRVGPGAVSKLVSK